MDKINYATKQWALLISFFRWYPDILEDICAGDNPEYSNSLLGRVTRRYMARYQENFTYACRMAQRLEQEELYGANRHQSSWSELIDDPDRQPVYRPRFERRMGRMGIKY